MSDAEDLAIATLRQELAVKEAEKAFREAKEAGTLTAEDKLALRQLRQEHRALRESAGLVAIGETVVSPDAIATQVEAGASKGKAG